MSSTSTEQLNTTEASGKNGDEKFKFKLTNVRRPCCGLFLRGSVKHIAIINTFLAAANMVILGAAVVDLWPGYYDNLPPVKRYLRLSFLAYFYMFWIFEFYHSVVLYRASKRHDVPGCMRWLYVQATCYVLFISAYATHCFWIVKMQISMEGARSRCFLHLVSAIYKPYTFWVIYSFVKEMRRNGGLDKVIAKLPDNILEECQVVGPKCSAEDSPVCQLDLNVEMDMDDLSDFVRVGMGVQSEVYKVKYRKYERPGDIVAVKVTKGSRLDHFKCQLEDLRIRASLSDHVNVVKLIGACTKNVRDLELQIVVEFCELGSLDTYLSNHRDRFMNQLDSHGAVAYYAAGGSKNNAGYILTQDLVKWCLEGSRALNHLHDHNIIHNDVAARNFLISADRTLKLTDFGYSVHLGKSNTSARSNQTYVPVLWMAPEVFTKLPQLTGLSYESDIWSFGVTMWEIFTFGEQPHKEHILTAAYHPSCNLNFSAFIAKLQSGCISRPEFAPAELFELMKGCWKSNAKERGKFPDIVRSLEIVLDSFTDGVPISSVPAGLPHRGCADEKEEQSQSQSLQSYVAFGIR